MVAFLGPAERGRSGQISGAVRFNGVPAIPYGWSESQITATIAPGTTTGPIVVNNLAGNSASGSTDFVVFSMAHTTDSLGNTTSYNSEPFGGRLAAGPVWADPTRCPPVTVTIRSRIC